MDGDTCKENKKKTVQEKKKIKIPLFMLVIIIVDFNYSVNENSICIYLLQTSNEWH